METVAEAEDRAESRISMLYIYKLSNFSSVTEEKHKQFIVEQRNWNHGKHLCLLNMARNCCFLK